MVSKCCPASSRSWDFFLSSRRLALRLALARVVLIAGVRGPFVRRRRAQAEQERVGARGVHLAGTNRGRAGIREHRCKKKGTGQAVALFIGLRQGALINQNKIPNGRTMIDSHAALDGY